jgi:transcriptional regulator with GAF, ATPase, and Fis domain
MIFHGLAVNIHGKGEEMPRLSRLHLDLWRETCRHSELGESAARAVPLLRRHLPVGSLLIRLVDPQGRCVETVAQAGSPNGAGTRTPCAEHDLDCLLRWCHLGQVVRTTAANAGRFAPAALPPGIVGEVLLGPLNTGHGPPGVLALVADAGTEGAHFTDTHAETMAALLEPFAVALENDRRLRELRTLRSAAEAENRSLWSRLGRDGPGEAIVGAETGLRHVIHRVDLVAGSDVPVLILGETGSGKEVVARAIHNRSRRAAGPFLRVNCGAIPPDIVDSQLFGHERGSFTGAVKGRAGWFERADGGTLFLDECGELPLAAQVRLLRILQDGAFERVGGEAPLQVNVRIVAATHRDLRAMTAEGRFREDLWYRLAVFPVQLPPLRDRREDIPALANHFALRAAHRFGLPPQMPTPEDLELLVAYPWPGNVRELASVIDRAAILGDGRQLEVAASLGVHPPRPAALAVPRQEPPAPFRTLDEAITAHIEAALRRTRGRIEGPQGAAALLGINPHTLRSRMRKLRLDWRAFRA